MRKALLLIAIVFTIAITGTANAQPNITVYFDSGLTLAADNCPSAPVGTVPATLYVVANNFNAWITAVEFQINYPPQLLFVGDDIDTPVVLGNTAAGVSIGWATPKSCFGGTVLAKVNVIWFCNDCVGNEDAPVDVRAHPQQGLPFARAVEWPSQTTFDIVGMLSLICATVPVEETTWGQIKALYN